MTWERRRRRRGCRGWRSARAGEGPEDLGAAVGGVVASDEGEGAHGDEVSGEEDEVGVKGVDALDDVLEEVGSVNSSRWMSLSWTMRKP